MKCLLYKLHVRMVYLVRNWHKTCEWMAHVTYVVKNDGKDIQNFWNRIFCNLISFHAIFFPTCLYVSTCTCFMCTYSVPVMKLRDFFQPKYWTSFSKGHFPKFAYFSSIVFFKSYQTWSRKCKSQSTTLIPIK